MPHTDKKNTYQKVATWLAKRQEFQWALVILALSLGLRLITVAVFPTIPISDFSTILDFATSFRHSWIPEGPWNFTNPGTSFFLSIVLQLVPANPADLSRFVTAIVTGLLPLFPFFIWRGVFSLRMRVVSALLLALWPDQIIFSGVLAQDNWVLLPAVALVCLAVRAVATKESGRPVLAAFLFALSVYIRQDMLLVLLPAALAAGMGAKTDLLRFAWGLITTAILLSLIAVQRGLATGRYALTTEHGPYGILGSYIPGKTLNWQDPKAYLAAVAPALLKSDYLSNFGFEYLRMTWEEIARRPAFHVIRRTGGTLHSLVYMFHGLSSWSIGQEGTMPPAIKLQANQFRSVAAPLFTGYDLLVHGLFITSLFFLYQNSKKKYFLFLSPLLLTIVLKLGVHTVVAAQSRYLMICMGLELLTIAMAAELLLDQGSSRKKLISLGLITILSSTGLLAATEAARYYVNMQENLYQQTYEFYLFAEPGRIRFDCRMEQGWLVSFYRDNATIRLLADSPVPGDKARVECQTINNNRTADLMLKLQDTFPKGRLEDSVFQSVFVNGELVQRYDIGAEARVGWTDVTLGTLQPGTDLSFAVELSAANPSGNENWGAASTTTFSLIAAPEE